MLKQPHYQYAPEMKPRYKHDPLAEDMLFRARANTFNWLHSFAPPISNPRLVSTAFGELDRILLTIPNYVFAYSAYSDVYEDLLGKLPASTQFIILAQHSIRQQLDAMLIRTGVAARTEVVAAPDLMRFTVWAEDAFAVTQDNATGASHFVEPASFPRQEDALIADMVAANTDLEHYHASLYYQGGNILIGDDYWLLGADYANKSVALGLIQPNPGESQLDAIKRQYGESLDNNRNMMLLGSTIPVPTQTERNITVGGQPWVEELYAGNGPGTVQPMFHIDMFVTLAGRDSSNRPIAVVGDPRIASQILNEPLETHAMAPIYDDIARKLEQQGFVVVRNPLPLVYQDDARARKRYWYFATANNALVKATASEKHVWLPTYGHGAWSDLAATDQENKRVWEALGFTVTMLGDFHPFAFNLGAVHCISKFIART